MDEVTPPIKEEPDHEDPMEEIKVLQDPAYEDPDYTVYATKYHKIEKGTPKMFSDIDLFQLPILLTTSLINQELTLKNEYTKLQNSLADPARNDSFRSSLKHTLSDTKEMDLKINSDFSNIVTDRFEHIEDKVQSFLEIMISKGASIFLEQNESKLPHLKKLSKSLKVTR